MIDISIKIGAAQVYEVFLSAAGARRTTFSRINLEIDREPRVIGERRDPDIPIQLFICMHLHDHFASTYLYRCTQCVLRFYYLLLGTVRTLQFYFYQNKNVRFRRL